MPNQLIDNKLKNFHVTFFSMIMGSAGVTIMFQKAADILNFPEVIAQIMLIFTSVLAITISVIYLAKALLHFSTVKAEYLDRIRINFFAAISISMLMLAIIYETVFPTVSTVLFYAGTILQSFLTFYTISFWINHNFEIHHSNPAWFIPIVGNLLVPVAGGHHLASNFLLAYFAIGMFFWIVLFTITINRIIFHHQLPEKFLPTFFIFLAPPSVGFIAYVKITGGVDPFSLSLLYIAYFFAILLVFMTKSFIKIKYYVSWWAFIFPLAAMSISSILAYKMTNELLYSYAAIIFAVAATSSFLYVSVFTLKHILNHDLCIEE